MNSNVFSKESSYFIEGIKHFNNQEFDKSKIFFERDLVFNPKSEKSYLFLAKIFVIEDKTPGKSFTSNLK